MIDFGSQLLLKCLEVNQGETVLDVGCGYGPLGLSLAKAYGVQATMVDINNRALDLARQNAERNKIEATIFQSNIYEQVEGKFDHVISNPPIRAGKQVVHEIIEKSKDFFGNWWGFDYRYPENKGSKCQVQDGRCVWQL